MNVAEQFKVSEMRRRQARSGMVTMCGGQGLATVFERVWVLPADGR